MTAMPGLRLLSRRAQPPGAEEGPEALPVTGRGQGLRGYLRESERFTERMCYAASPPFASSACRR